jgi:hypothetical protein
MTWRQFLNVANDDDWYLVVFWLLAALRPSGPYPVLVLHGEQGSAKSTLTQVLRSLVDPNKAPLRSEPKDARDLMIAAHNGWLIVLDNLSHLSPWLSDALCRLATGGGFATRELYTDAEEVLFEAQRPVILNGIEELATRSDLLDRSIVQYLPPIPEDQRRPEGEFWADYDKARPSILGAFLNVVGTAMQNIGTVSLNELPRMADFALWAAAAAPALGLEPDHFVKIYHHNRESAHELALEVSPIVPALQDLVAQQSWEGSATELLNALNTRTDEAIQRQKSWPRQPRSLSNALRRLAPNLRAVGLEVDFLRESHTRKWLVRIRKIRDFSVPTVPHEAETGDATPGDGDENLSKVISSIHTSGDSGDAKIPIHSKETNYSHGRVNPASTFTPTHEWQEVPEGAICPPGLEFHLNLQTGKRLARIPPEVDKGQDHAGEWEEGAI